MICKKCGNEIKDDSSFCSQCGKKTTKLLGKIKEFINSIRKTNNKKKLLIVISIICLITFCGTINYIINKRNEKIINEILKNTIDFDQKNSNVKDATSSDKNINTNNTDVEKNDIVSKVNFSINQVDSSNFPNVDVYFSAKDKYKKDINDLVKENINIKESQDSNTEILDLKKASDKNLNMHLVVQDTFKYDGSKSPLIGIKNVLNKYIDTIKFDSGDKLALTSFNRGAILHPSYLDDGEQKYVKEIFLSDKDIINSKINKLGVVSEDVSYIYDALYLSLIETNKQSGQKCIIAIASKKDSGGMIKKYEDVIELAKKLNIPINIIAVGLDNSEYNNVASQTGGQYISITKNSSENIDDRILKSLKDIYNEYKSQYIISTKVSNNCIDGKYRDISIEGKNQITGSKVIRYLPKFMVDAKSDSSSLQYNISDPEKAVHDHIYSLTKGLKTLDGSNKENNIDNMQPYLDTSSQLYSKMKEKVILYKNLDSRGEVYYTIKEVNKNEDNTYTIYVIEHILDSWGMSLGVTKYVDENVTYTVSSTPDGWRVTDKNTTSEKEAFCNFDTMINN